MIGRAMRRATIRSSGAGQTLVEFALVIVVFLALLLAFFDLGRVVYAQNAINQDAHAAARFASLEAPRTSEAILEEARSVSPAVEFPDSAISGEGGVADNYYPLGTAEGQPVVVQIVLPVPLLTPILSTIFNGSITVTARSEELIH